MRSKGHERIKSDERILGESDFVMEVLAEANETLHRSYELKRLGFDLKKIEQKVSELYDIESDELYAKGRRKRQAEARSLFCYWAVSLLGFTRTAMAKLLGMTQPAIGYAVNRGHKIARENSYNLLV